jgi:alanine or glycine:cation symporter, AGCS family
VTAAQTDAANEPAAVGFIDHVTNVSDFIWGGAWNGEELIPFPPMVIVLLGIGLYMMVGLRFYPIRQLWPAFTGLFRKTGRQGRRDFILSPRCRPRFPARSAPAIWPASPPRSRSAGRARSSGCGSPRSSAWRSPSPKARSPSATAKITPEGTYRGGPMAYITYGLGPKWKWLAIFFSIGTLISALVTGNMIQANSAGASIQQLTGLEALNGAA